MTFATPLALLLLIPLALRIGIAVRERRRGEAAFVLPFLPSRGGGRTLRSRLSFLPLVVETLALVLLIVALARPQRVTQRADERFGIDIVVALDASGSMAAEDFKPLNRFAVARELLGKFIEQRVSDRIGVVTFGARAATRVPITYDRDVVKEILDAAKIGENGDGTAIGHAIATSANRLRGSQSRSRVIILVTDGVNNAGSIDPETAAKIAAQLGIRIYTIGVGSRGPVPMPMKFQNPITGEIETVLRIVRADLDEPMLQRVARATNGAYFRATDTATLAAVLQRIDGLEKSRIAGSRSFRVHELYAGPLTVGLILLSLAILAGETLWMRLPA